MGSRRLALGFWSILVFAFASATSSAQPLPRERVPAPLAPWVDWVLESEPTFGCPVLDQSAICVFPGMLSLLVTASGATFTQEVTLDRRGRLELAWGAWRVDATVDGQRATVIEVEGAPAVELDAGVHRIEGRFAWDRMPEVLRVPDQTAIVELTVSGERIALPHREDDGTLWLGRRNAPESDPERLAIEVYRRIDDGIPLAVKTHIVLRAGGRAREVDLGVVGLPGATPIALSSDLPARLDATGRLAVQVRPGTHTVTLDARLDARRESLAAPRLPDPWPPQETWVFGADPALRQVQTEGAPSIDPARTAMPQEWRALPAFVLDAGRALALRTIRRGHPEPPPSAIDVAREIWLDLDGVGITARDTLTGTVRRGFRLDLRSGHLGHVKIDGEDQLITRGPGGPGVELRRETLQMEAEWRTNGATSDLPAVAWSEDAHSLATRLHLPPGYQLVAAAGVDQAPGTWVARWDVFAFFFVLIVALATGRLLGVRAGAIALLALVLTYGEEDAPREIWIALLALLALVRVLPEGVFRKLVRWAFALTSLVFIVVAVPYAIGELRTTIHPRLAPNRPEVVSTDGATSLEEAVPVEAPAASMGEDGAGRRVPSAEDAEGRPRSSSADWVGRYGSTDFLRQDPNAVVQTGPGVPRWQHATYALSWSGPVARDHRIQLVWLTPWMRSVAGALRVLFLSWLALLLLPAGRRARPRERKGSSGSAAVAAAVCLLLAGVPAVVQAQDVIPSAELLTELHDRLVAPPACAPTCANVSTMRLAVQGSTLTIDLEIDAGALAAVRLPGPAPSFLPSTVTLDGSPTSSLAAGEGHFVLLRVPAGHHVARLVGPIVGDQLVLALGEAPDHVTVTAPSWDVQGVRDDGHADDTVRLVRLAAAAQGGGDLGPQNVSPWLEVERTLEVGVRWIVRTHVRRVSPLGAPIVARLPLLEGEQVGDPAVTVEAGRAVISLGRDQEALDFESSLAPRPTLVLEAPAGVPYAEVWRLRCGSVQRCRHEGLVPVAHVEQGLWSPAFRPFPGERLSLSFARPEAARGTTTTIDRAQLSLSPGIRRLSATLTVELRASRGGVHAFTLPPGARVEALEVQGQAQPIELRGRALRVTLRPGSQSVTIRFQRKEGLGTVFRAPAVGLGAEAANVNVEVELPADRLLLFTTGPSWGPIVLFWPLLLLAVLAAVLLARVGRTPLGVVEWALLALGLTQIPVPAALVVVAWIIAMAHRERRPDLGIAAFDLRQIGLALLTLVALGCLYAAVHVGLLLRPDVQVAGGGSTATDLLWYVDRTAGSTPTASVVSVPLFAYRLVMLAWALFLAVRLLTWLPWAFRAYGTGGYWKLGGRPPVPPSSGSGASSGTVGSAPTGPSSEGVAGLGEPKDERPRPS
jgi:hypothetical protein